MGDALGSDSGLARRLDDRGRVLQPLLIESGACASEQALLGLHEHALDRGKRLPGRCGHRGGRRLRGRGAGVGMLHVSSVQEPAADEQYGDGCAYGPHQQSGRQTGRAGHGSGDLDDPAPLIIEALDGGIRKQPGARRRQGLVDESIDGAVADQPGELGFRFAVAGHDDDQIRKLALDVA